SILLTTLAYITVFHFNAVLHENVHSIPTRRSSDLVRSDRKDRPALFASSGKGYPVSHKWNEGQGSRIQTRCDGGAVLYQKTPRRDRKSTRLNSSHVKISYAVFCLKKKIKSNIYSIN